MEGNRHNFTKFLYGAIIFLSAVLGSFGCLGYLRYGDDMRQMINANIPSGEPLGIAVNVCLCVGVVLTYPLQIYPVIELAEHYLFGKGRVCGPESEEVEPNESQPLLPQADTAATLSVTRKLPRNVSVLWRNVLRIFLVLCSGGLAVLLRDYFAYISAFVGALGSTTLAFILPCLFHLRLCWSDLSWPIRIKDCTIIFLGVCLTFAGVYSSLSQIIRGTAEK